MQAAEEEWDLQAEGDGFVAQVAEVAVGHVRAPALRVLVLQLDHDDRAAALDLVGGDNGDHFLVPAVHGGQELRIIFPDAHTRLESQPDRIAAAIPFRADVGAGPHDRVQAHRLDQLEEGIEVFVAGEVPLSFLRLVEVPKGVGLDGVESGALDTKQPVAPEGAGYAAVVETAGGEKRALAFDEEAVPVEVDERLCGRRRGKDAIIRVGGESSAAEQQNGERHEQIACRHGKAVDLVRHAAEFRLRRQKVLVGPSFAHHKLEGETWQKMAA